MEPVLSALIALCECGCGNPAPISTRHRRHRGQVKGQPVRFIRGHAMRGKKMSAETLKKMSAAHTGLRHTPEVRARMAAQALSGPAHPEWKGDDIAYSSIHSWIGRVAVKTGACSLCGERRTTQWANLSGEYKRDVSDFAEMCVPCHKRFDYAKKRAVA